MKLCYLPISAEITIKSNDINFLVLESANLLDKFTYDLMLQFNKEKQSFILLDDENNELGFSKNVAFISNPFDLIYNKKEVQKVLLPLLVRDLEEMDCLGRLATGHSEITGVLDELLLNSEYDLEYEEELYPLDILKNFDIRLRNPEGSFCERLSEYIVTLSKLLTKKIFIVVNCSAYLEKEDYNLLRKTVAYNEIIIVFVENRQCEDLLGCNTLIIDKDLCEIG